MTPAAIARREQVLGSGISPWLSPLAMLLTQDVALRGYFRSIAVIDRVVQPAESVIQLPEGRVRQRDVGGLIAAVACNKVPEGLFGFGFAAQNHVHPDQVSEA